MTANVPRVGSRDETVKWFDQTVTVPPQARDLLETYSRIPADKVEDHVLTIVGLPRVVRTHPSIITRRVSSHVPSETRLGRSGRTLVSGNSASSS